MFRVKICGVTNVEDALAAVDAGADAIGLNFYEKSPRYVTLPQAGTIARAIERRTAIERHSENPLEAKEIAVIGVVVNLTAEDIHRIAGEWRMRIKRFQLHGDESPSIMASFGPSTRSPLPPTSWRIIRARRFGDDGVAALARDLDECERAGRRPDAVLVDAMTPGRYGGTGETVSWVGLADHRRWLGDVPLILAGGLTPDNVAEAIRIVRPAAVDVASGVESAPGRKDPAKVRDFVANALGAFEGLGGT